MRPQSTIARTSNFSSSADEKPNGFCVDIGAPRSVVGKSQLNNILQYIGQPSIPLLRSANSYRFGDVTVRSIGLVEIALATPPRIPAIPVLMDIVPVNVPALLGLDVLDAEELIADNVTNRLIHRHVVSRTHDNVKYKDKWSMPLKRHDNHLVRGHGLPAVSLLLHHAIGENASPICTPFCQQTFQPAQAGWHTSRG